MRKKKHTFRRVVAETNIFDLSIGLAVAYVFVELVNSFVVNILNPLMSAFLGIEKFNELMFNINFVPGQKTFSVRYGLLLDAFTQFLIVVAVVYWAARLILRIKMSWIKSCHNGNKICPKCCLQIPAQATRCGHCTSEL